MTESSPAAGTAEALAQFLYGDAPLDAWPGQNGGELGEPWRSFERARELARSGQPAEAISSWLRIASTEDLESRQILQAWHFLRQASCPPPAETAKLVLGVVVEMPVDDGHDLLAAYRDGSARYLNYSGAAVVWEDRTVSEVQSAIDSWLATGQAIADAAGPWDQPSLPPVPAGAARVMALTPSGPHFGQGPAADLQADPLADAFIAAATSVLQLIVNQASP